MNLGLPETSSIIGYNEKQVKDNSLAIGGLERFTSEFEDIR